MKFRFIILLTLFISMLILISCSDTEENSEDNSNSKQSWYMDETDCNDDKSKYWFVLNPDGTVNDDSGLGVGGGREKDDSFYMFVKDSNDTIIQTWTGVLYEKTGNGTFTGNPPYSCGGTWQAYFDKYVD